MFLKNSPRQQLRAYPKSVVTYCIFKIDNTVIRTDAGYYRSIVTLKNAIIDFSDRLLILPALDSSFLHIQHIVGVLFVHAPYICTP